jgi:predicted branched-subunit amino acid permease
MSQSILVDRPTTPTTSSASAAESRQRPVRLGVSDGLSLTPSLAPFGVTLGVAIATLGFDKLAGVLGAGVVYAGSAQMTAVTLFHTGMGLAAVVASAAIVNARLLLYSAALSPSFNRQPRWFRTLAPHFIIDQTYLMATTRPDLDPRDFRRYWLALGSCVLAAWTATVTLGVVVGPALPELPHLIFVGTVMFLGMLVPRLCDKPSIAAAVAGGLVAAVVSVALPALGIVAGAVAGVVAGIAVSNR